MDALEEMKVSFDTDLQRAGHRHDLPARPAIDESPSKRSFVTGNDALPILTPAPAPSSPPPLTYCPVADTA